MTIGYSYIAWHLKIDKAPIMRQKGNIQQVPSDVKNASIQLFFHIPYWEVFELSNEVLYVPPAQGAAKLDIIKV